MVGELASPLFIGAVTTAITKKQWDETNRLSIIWLALTGVFSIFSGLQSYLYGWISNTIGMQVRYELFQDIISKDVEFFDSRKTGDLISRLQSDTEKIENAVSTQLGMCVKSILYIIICIGIFFFISW